VHENMHFKAGFEVMTKSLVDTALLFIKNNCVVCEGRNSCSNIINKLLWLKVAAHQSNKAQTGQ